MYNAPAEFYDAVRAPSREDRLSGTITLKNGDVIELETKSFSYGTVEIVRQCVVGEDLEFGNAILSQLSFSLRTKQSRYVFYDAKVALSYAVKTKDGEWPSIALGEFTVGEAERVGNSVKMVAYDNVLALDKEYDGDVLQGTPFEVSTLICEACGLNFAMTKDEVAALVNGASSIHIDEKTGCETYRDCIKVVAQMMAAFVVADQNGAIAYRRYSSDVTATMTATERFSLSAADYVCRYTVFTVKYDDKIYSSADTTVDSGLEFVMQDPPAWEYGTEEHKQEMADAYMEELKGLAYTPSTATIIGDPTIECGDRILYTTPDGDVSSLVTTVRWKFQGRCKLESKGQNPRLRTVRSQRTQIIREIAKQTEANKLIFYSFTNQAAADVSGTEIEELAKVVFVTVEDTSAMFLAQLPVTVTVEDEVETAEVEHEVAVTDSAGATAEILDSEGNPLTLKVVHSERTVKPGAVDLEIHYYLNGSKVEYELVEHLTAGKHILSLFYPFAELKGNQNNEFSVRLRCASGSVSIAKRALKATVTGQGLAATTVWDGTLEFEEVVPPISLVGKMSLVAAVDEVTTETQVPKGVSFAETVSGFSLLGGMTLVGITERVSTAEIREKRTIDTAEWEYTDRYVNIENSSIMARVKWQYESAEAQVDEGRMTVVKAVTADLASVESVEVK